MDIDLKEFAFGVLQVAKENLARDGQLVAIAFIVSPAGIDAKAVDPFESPEEKYAVYRRIVEAARAAHALAIVTLNDAYYHNEPTREWLETYHQGKLENDRSAECINITVSGPGIQTWDIRLPYSRTAEGISFGAVEESTGGRLSLLEGWASASDPSAPS